jgi:sugar phosphate isomerase/epimerase
MLSKEQFGFNAFWWETLHTEAQLNECVEYLAGLGFRRVEFKANSFPNKDLPGEFSLAAKCAEAAGLKVSNFVFYRSIGIGHQQSVDDFVGAMAACAAAGVGLINTLADPFPKSPRPRPKDDWWMPPTPNHKDGWDCLVRELDQICKAGDKYGVTLALEHGTGCIMADYYRTQELLNRFDHPRLGFTLDPSHLVMARNDIPYAIERLGKRIRHVHMKDIVGVPGAFNLDFVSTALGAGGVDWKGVFEALDESGYTGALSCEYEQFKYLAHVHNNDPHVAAQLSYQDLNGLFENLYLKSGVTKTE